MFNSPHTSKNSQNLRTTISSDNLLNIYERKKSRLTSNSNVVVKKSNYVGERGVNRQKQGFGILKWEDKSKYIGFFKNDKANGYGKLRHTDGFYYKGEFNEDKAWGYGMFTGLTGAEYEGYWENDTQNGIGKEILKNSHSYEGAFVNGKKCGIGKEYTFILGTYTWSNGSIYKGEWKDNQLHGRGVYYFADGKVYLGEFADNMMNGYGEFYWKDGKKYIGYYLDDKKDGFGVHFWPDPDRMYIGFWKDGKQEGVGKFIKNNTAKYGLWANGERIRFFDSRSQAVSALPSNLIKFQVYFKIESEKLLEFLNTSIS